MHTIGDATAEILREGRVEDCTFFLPEGQLDRDVYVSVDKVLKGLGGKWDRKLHGHVFPFDPEPKLDEALESGGYVSRQQTLQMFETPEDLAERMVTMVNVGLSTRVLEPSAGPGRIVRALLSRGANVTAVEIDRDNCDALEEIGGVSVQWGDFLDYAADQPRTFEAVVMNPPFTKGQDIEHVTDAYSLLEPGGALVSVMSESPFFNDTKRAKAFRDWLDEVDARVEKLPGGTFKASGTGVNARLVTIERAG